MEEIVKWLETNIAYFANIVIYLLEFIGIISIVVGAIRAIILLFDDTIHKKHHNIKISLANALSLGLEFKMGAEIIKTVVIHEPSELVVLGAIIILRALLAFLIHWEIKVEKKEENELREACRVLKDKDETNNE